MSPAIKTQAKLVGIALAAGLAWTAFGPGTALAASVSERECEAQGGTYVKDGPDAMCVEKVGNQPENSQGQTTTESGQGNINNKTTCSGPPGQRDEDCP